MVKVIDGNLRRSVAFLHNDGYSSVEIMKQLKKNATTTKKRFRGYNQDVL